MNPAFINFCINTMSESDLPNDNPTGEKPAGHSTVQNLITTECALQFSDWVYTHNGNEVFAIGTCDETGIVTSLEPIAYGNKNSVPAPAQNATTGQVLIHNHPSGILEPSSPDISLASMYGKSGIGFYIVNNDCSQVRVVVRPFKEQKIVDLNQDELLHHFGPNGELAQTMPGYEVRTQQLEMMAAVTKAFNNNKILSVEAGTGTGKSFAYLAPGITWALENKKRVVVSTNTINLQEQLLEKDLPELEKHLKREFKAVLLKGRSNYISRRRLQFAVSDYSLFSGDKNSELQQIRSWASNTEDGTRAELPFQIQEDTWEAIMSDKDDCHRAQCPHFNECFYYKSRRAASAADLIVANHHLVMADIALKMDSEGNDYAGILPPYDRIIFDEAHHLEEVATNYFSGEINLFSIRRQLNRLVRPRDKMGALALFHGSISRIPALEDQQISQQIIKAIEEYIIPGRDDVDYGIEQNFAEIFQSSVRFFQLGNLSKSERREFRIKPEITGTQYWDDTITGLQTIRDLLQRFLKPIEHVIDLTTYLSETSLAKVSDNRSQLHSILKKLQEQLDTINFFLSSDDNENCRWIEVGYYKERPFIRPCIAPLNITKSLRSSLFRRKKTIVLASATLTVENKFDYFSRQLGIGFGSSYISLDDDDDDNDVPDKENLLYDLPPRLDFLKLGTPFDYHKQCKVGIPKDLPLPSDPDFDTAIINPIIDLIKIRNGKTFVLFTSYKAMQYAYERCRLILDDHSIKAIKQGELPRNKLLNLFKSSSRCALFATASFWEGVDVQGDSLESVIITKLPFSVPSTPLLEARAERLEKLGGNSFYELSLPLAVIKFKQGFGRLIRSKSDIGVVSILDNRVVTKSYGKMFLKSLPPVSIIQGTFSSIHTQLIEFFEGHNPDGL